MLPAKNSQSHDPSNSKFSNCTNGKPSKKDKENCTHNELWLGTCKCDTDSKKNKKKNTCECDNYLASGDFTSKKESGSSSDHSHDCGYSSENNNGCCETGSLISSLSSSRRDQRWRAQTGVVNQNQIVFRIIDCRLEMGSNLVYKKCLR